MAGFVNAVLNCENINIGPGLSATGDFNANGQLIIGGVAAPNLAVGTLTAGAGISITNGQNSITIAATSTGLSWSNISANQTLASNNGYFVDASGGAISLALPAIAAVGDTYRVYRISSGANQVTITQGAGQSIQIGSSASTTGAGGSIATTAQGDCVEIVCHTANTGFAVASLVGNFTVV